MENNKIDYRFDKCRYACGQLYIRESMHVADGMDECIIAIADKINKAIVEKIMKERK